MEESAHNDDRPEAPWRGSAEPATRPSARLDGVIATRQRRRHSRSHPDHRTRRLAGFGSALLLTVLLAAFMLSSGSSDRAPAGLSDVNAAVLVPNGPPHPQTLASAGTLNMSVPITQGRITAIVYHGVGATNAIPLQPVGNQRNAGFLARLGEMLFGGGSSGGPSYYVDDSAQGPDTASVDVGAPAGTNVYAPVSGTIVSIRPYILNGQQWGSVVQIRPQGAPATNVVITNINKARDVDVGTAVTASTTLIGTVLDLSKVLQQDVARFTSDAGNHVAIQLVPAPGSTPLL
jgi:hypothetical protein